MTVFFQCQLHSEEIHVADVLISLGGGQLPGVKCHWVELGGFSPNRCERMVPTPVSEASMMKGLKVF